MLVQVQSKAFIARFTGYLDMDLPSSIAALPCFLADEQ
jgi:hypothetical protein